MVILNYHAPALALLAFVLATQQLPPQQLFLLPQVLQAQVRRLQLPPQRLFQLLQHRAVPTSVRSLLAVVLFKAKRGAMTVMVGCHQNGAKKLRVTVQPVAVCGVLGRTTEDYFKDTEMFDIHC